MLVALPYFPDYKRLFHWCSQELSVGRDEETDSTSVQDCYDNVKYTFDRNLQIKHEIQNPGISKEEIDFSSSFFSRNRHFFCFFVSESS